MEHNNPDDPNDPNRTPPSRFSGLLSGLFDGRFFGNRAEDTQQTPEPFLQPGNNLVPFFDAQSVFAPPEIQEQSSEKQRSGSITPTDSTAPQMPQGHNVVFCVDDTVGLVDDKYSVGIVDRAFGDVDSHEPRPQRDYAEDIEHHPDVPFLEFTKFMNSGIPPRGTVLVSWQTQLKTELIPESKLSLLDRAFYIGDVVKKSSEDHMTGIIVGKKCVCTLFPATMFHSGQVTQAVTDDLSIRNVPSSELVSVHEFVENALIVYNGWVGRIENVYDEVAVRLSNNSVVVVEDPGELEQDVPTAERLAVGDSVKTKKGNLRRGRWKYGAFDPNIKPAGMVVETRTTEIDVQWLGMSIAAQEHSRLTDEPPANLSRDELESQGFFLYDASHADAATLPVTSNGGKTNYHVADIAVGDRVRFEDILGAAVKYDGTHTIPNGYPQGKVTRVPRTETLGYDMNVFLVMQTHTQVTVKWQDLSITEHVSSVLLPDSNVSDEDEVWPGEMVFSREGREHSSSDQNWSKKPAKVGIVQTVKSRDRLASIRWFEEPSVEFFGPDLLRPCTTGKLLEAKEEVSFYDIYTNPALTRRRADFVLLHPMTAEQVDQQALASVSGPNWCGEVVDLSLDGKLTVRLGAAKPVIDIQVPYESVTLIYSPSMADEFMEGSDDDSSMDSEDEISDSESFQEMWVEYEGMDGEQNAGNEEDWSTEDEDELDEDESMPDLESLPDLDTSETTPELKTSDQNTDPGTPTRSTATDTPITNQQNSAAMDKLESFLILDTPAPSSHHYYSRTTSSTTAFMRRIAKEHKILRGSLPPGIFVRTWESRLDLIRVLMIGPNDTPYEYAPFVIDFHLGSTYPQEPPEAFFHSWTNGAGPVNPNLYEDGKICLSLLGTWHTDERNEGWSPAKSTLLQVLVSLMGLVLVKDPYYNEAGFDIHRSAPEMKLNSALYTERAYFRARGFIHHALTTGVLPFYKELQYLYTSQEEGAPRLLKKAIEVAKEVVAQSEDAKEDAERDGLHRISLGATVMLKRQIEKLEKLNQGTS